MQLQYDAMDSGTDFLTPGEIADELRVSRMTVNRWLNSGRLPASRFGGVWRIARADFDRFKASAKARG